VVVVDQGGVGVSEGLFSQVPPCGPGQGVFADARRVGHAGEAEVGGLGHQSGVEVAAQVRGSVGGAAGVDQVVGEPGPGVDFDEQAGQVDVRQLCAGIVAEGDRFGGDLFGGQGGDNEIAVSIETSGASVVGQDRVEGSDGGHQLAVEVVESLSAVDVGGGEPAELLA